MPKTQEKAVIDNGEVYVLQAGTPIFVKTADICAMTGKSNQWVGQLASQGIINKSKTPHGVFYNLRDTMHSYCAMLESRFGDAATAGLDAERLEAEVKLKKAKATVAELEAKELQGKMHRSEDVANMTEDLIFTIRGALLALPGRLAVDVSAAGTAADAAEVIKREVYKVMTELSRYRYDSAKYEERVRERRSWSAAELHNLEDGE